MFTGIVRELGIVKELKRTGDIHRLSIVANDVSKDAAVGDSISVNGVCLTVVKAGGNELVFEIMDESLKRSNLGRLRKNDRVNLEASLKLGDRLGGHMVSGHIDMTGTIKKIARSGQTCEIRIEFPPEFKRYIVPKGAIAVDGVSLTVGEVGGNWFSVYIIPHTLKFSRFGLAKIRDSVNIELDLLAKYTQNMASKDRGVTEALLKEKGFI